MCLALLTLVCQIDALFLISNTESDLYIRKVFYFLHTMTGFENSHPQTQAWNLAPTGVILFQFQKFKNLAHDP